MNLFTTSLNTMNPLAVLIQTHAAARSQVQEFGPDKQVISAHVAVFITRPGWPAQDNCMFALFCQTF